MVRIGMKAAVAACALALLAGFSTSVRAAPIDDVFVFGDSLSDVGNLCLSSPTNCPPSPPYAPGRFSNGPLYDEIVAQHFGVTLTPSLLGGNDYAFAGARAGTVDLSTPAPPGITQQAAQFLINNAGVADPNSLYIIGIGGNDIEAALQHPGDANAIISNAIANIGFSISELVAGGAKRFAVLNVPDIGKTPGVLALGSTVSAFATEASALFDQGLNLLLASEPSSLDIADINTFGLLDAVSANPGAFGFSDVTDECVLSPACIANPNGFLFWDDLHPTAQGHQFLADAVIEAVPEPATGLLLVAGLFGLGALRRRRAEPNI